jgi:hypothetical protein
MDVVVDGGVKTRILSKPLYVYCNYCGLKDCDLHLGCSEWLLVVVELASPRLTINIKVKPFGLHLRSNQKWEKRTGLACHMTSIWRIHTLNRISTFE